MDVILVNNIIYMTSFFGIGPKIISRMRLFIGALDILYGIIASMDLAINVYMSGKISSSFLVALVMIISFVILNGISHIMTFIKCERIYKVTDDIKIVFNYEEDDKPCDDKACDDKTCNDEDLPL